MPEKSVREMNRYQRRHYSLSARVFRATLLNSLILGFVALIIGLGLYTFVLIRQYIREAYQLSKSAAACMEKVVDIAPMSRRVMELYGGMTQEEQADQGTVTYDARFSEITAMPEYERARDLLRVFLENGTVDAIYLGMYDESTSALVYIADPDPSPESFCAPGEYDFVNSRELRRFLQSDGTRLLYDIDRTEKYGWMCTAGVPILDQNGKAVAFVLSDITLDIVMGGVKSFFWLYSIAMFILVNTVAIISAKRIQKNLSQPINEIAAAAERYVTDRKKGFLETDHFAMLNISTGDEIENLALVMADMERDLGDYTENLLKVTSEKERLGAELELATQIQASMLPNVFPAFPEREEFDIYASMTPAKEVGGDFYDFFLIDEDHLCLVIADVSGKGIPAALFMMASMIMVRNQALTGKSPANVLEEVNRQICSNNKLELFVTMWLGVLEISTGKLIAANAGHEYPILKQSDGAFQLLRDPHGLVVGGLDDTRYRNYDLKLTPGSKLFLYTDGVAEATNGKNELFGTDRTLEILQLVKDLNPDEILNGVDRAVSEFVGDAPQFDDLTMLCVHYLGAQKPPDGAKT